MYVSLISSISGCILDQLNSIHKEFIWDNKKAKIKHSTLIANYEQGGLKDIDINTKIKALQLSWIRRLHDSNFHPWKVIPTYLFSKISPLGVNIFYPNLILSFKNKNIPVFYQNILQFWAEFSQSEPFTASSVLSECIWYNSHITVGDNVIRPSFFSINKAIFVADLFDNDGNVSSWLDFSSKNEISGTKYFNWVQLITLGALV